MSLEPVEMGISSVSMLDGIDPSVALTSNDNYSYLINCFDRYVDYPDQGLNNWFNDANLSLFPHWRKFKIAGLQLAEGNKIMIKYRNYGGANNSDPVPTGYKIITPEISNSGDVYFYIYTSNFRGTVSPPYQVTTVGIDFFPFDSENGLEVISIQQTTGGTIQAYKREFEIYYEGNNGFINTNLIFTVN